MKPIESLPLHEIFCFKDVDMLHRVSTCIMYSMVLSTFLLCSISGHQIDELPVMSKDGIEIREDCWLSVEVLFSCGY